MQSFDQTLEQIRSLHLDCGANLFVERMCFEMASSRVRPVMSNQNRIEPHTWASSPPPPCFGTSDWRLSTNSASHMLVELSSTVGQSEVNTETTHLVVTCRLCSIRATLAHLKFIRWLQYFEFCRLKRFWFSIIKNQVIAILLHISASTTSRAFTHHILRLLGKFPERFFFFHAFVLR